ncbi:MAG: L,D-transpeptidase family protein [Deltaproteobacteria bacterium]|nr:L,D-transpeptidase family protein [Deltaproteobacteria bacterium]
MQNALICLFLLVFLLAGSLLAAGPEIDSVLVKKSARKMFLLSQGQTIKEYQVAFGAKPKGHKLREGDERTPEGRYRLDYKKENSTFFRAIHISYPNEEDKSRAKAAKENPGGQIMIHGQPNSLGWLSWITQWFNWTDGCIAVSNSDMAEIWELVKAGTPIEIQP